MACTSLLMRPWPGSASPQTLLLVPIRNPPPQNNPQTPIVSSAMAALANKANPAKPAPKKGKR